MIVANRGAYVRAGLIMVRAYLCAGTPDPPPPFMSFAGWNRLVRGTLMWLGYADPVQSTATLAEEDPDTERRVEVFNALAQFTNMTTDAYTTAALAKLAERNERLYEALKPVAEDDEIRGRIDGNRLGQWFRWNRDRIVGRLKLVKTGNKWLLKDPTIIARPRR
jgi:hypothetical protein